MTLPALEALFRWTRQACGRRAAPKPHHGPDRRVFRLQSWPELPDAMRTAPVYRMLSTMTVRPVTRAWMHMQSGLAMNEIDRLLGVLAQSRVLVTIQPAPVGPAR